MSERPYAPLQANSGDPPGNRERASFARGMAAGALVALILCGLLFLWLRAPSPPPVEVHAPPAILGSASSPVSITVHVSGEVARPGVYAVPEGSRVVDGLERAGGMTARADPHAVNQALRLSDGAHVFVPVLGATRADATGATITSTRGTGIEWIVTPLNLNTASLDELMELPNIGEVRARQIIAGRPYTTVEGLDRVQGIGPATLEKLRQLVSAP